MKFDISNKILMNPNKEFFFEVKNLYNQNFYIPIVKKF